MRTMRLAAVLAAAILLCGGGLARAQDASGFAAFWGTFQQAVRTRDVGTLTSLTFFPLAVAGQLDSDPVRYVSKARFPRESRQFLGQDVGRSAAEEPMRAYILRTAPPASASAGTGPVQVGTFRFEQRAGAWRLVRVTEER